MSNRGCLDHWTQWLIPSDSFKLLGHYLVANQPPRGDMLPIPLPMPKATQDLWVLLVPKPRSQMHWAAEPRHCVARGLLVLVMSWFVSLQRRAGVRCDLLLILWLWTHSLIVMGRSMNLVLGDLWLLQLHPFWQISWNVKHIWGSQTHLSHQSGINSKTVTVSMEP